jgi:Rrf2 family protein
MFKVSRKSEYALLAVQVLSQKSPGALVSVADLAASEAIPQDILAKVLQGLKRAGVLEAAKGSGGGYKLARPVAEIRFLDVIRPFEEQIAVVACQDLTGCDREDHCRLRDPMAVLNAFVMRQIETLTMDLFLAPGLQHATRGNAHPVVPMRGLVLDHGLGRHGIPMGKALDRAREPDLATLRGHGRDDEQPPEPMA